jgi:hypothetical protein
MKKGKKNIQKGRKIMGWVVQKKNVKKAIHLLSTGRLNYTWEPCGFRSGYHMLKSHNNWFIVHEMFGER